MTEIHTTMSIDDVDLAVIALEEWQDAERRAHEKANRR
jgi:hypothetical protein